jgi:hypothetical protein
MQVRKVRGRVLDMFYARRIQPTAGQLPAGAPLMFGIDATTFPGRMPSSHRTGACITRRAGAMVTARSCRAGG